MVASGPPRLNHATRAPCSFTSLSHAGFPSVWQFMHRNRIAQTFDANDSVMLSARACRTTSTGLSASAGALAFAPFSAGSSAHALIHAENAAYSASRTPAGMSFAPGSVLPRPMSLRMRESSPLQPKVDEPLVAEGEERVAGARQDVVLQVHGREVAIAGRSCSGSAT